MKKPHHLTTTHGSLLNRQFNLPKIGLRNLKTAISATICALLYALIGRNPTFACIGAVFAMDNTLPASWKTGGNRLMGTFIGGLLGIALFSVYRLLPQSPFIKLALLFVGIILLIYISQLFRLAGAIQAGAVVFCIIMFNTPAEAYVSYAINRTIDTGVGVIVSILINWIHIKSPAKFSGDPPTDTIH